MSKTSNEPTIRLEYTDESEETCSVADFLAANGELEPAELAAVATLGLGDDTMIGGGAAPLMRIERVA